MVADKRYNQLEQVREWLSAAAYPVQAAVDLPFRAWTGSPIRLPTAAPARGELELTARLRLANLQLQRFAALEDENRRLRDMRELGRRGRPRAGRFDHERGPRPFRHRVLVDRARGDGVFKGQAVLDAEGIFGQVSQVHAETAEVILISDAEHAIPVQSNRSGVRTIAVGTGDSDRLSLPFVTVESTSRSVTCSFPPHRRRVPRGYPVAEVTRVDRTAAATFALVDARPTARLDRNREVLLVWFTPPARTLEPAAADATEAAEAAASRRRASGRACRGATAVRRHQLHAPHPLLAQRGRRPRARHRPLPEWLSPVRPDLALLAVIYWILTSPRIAGLGYAWLAACSSTCCRA